MYEKEKTLILSSDFRFRFSAENECPFSFSAVNGISFSSVLSFMAENEKCFSGSASSIQHEKVLVLILRCKVLFLVLSTGLVLDLGLERILKSWSWS